MLSVVLQRVGSDMLCSLSQGECCQGAVILLLEAAGLVSASAGISCTIKARPLGEVGRKGKRPSVVFWSVILFCLPVERQGGALRLPFSQKRVLSRACEKEFIQVILQFQKQSETQSCKKKKKKNKGKSSWCTRQLVQSFSFFHSILISTTCIHLLHLVSDGSLVLQWNDLGTFCSSKSRKLQVTGRVFP